jgi:hypothetical protein
VASRLLGGRNGSGTGSRFFTVQSVAEEIKELVWRLYRETIYLSVSQAIPDSLYL